jgi:hypothetical protein
MKLDCKFVVGDEVQVIGHSDWGDLTVIGVDVIYTVSNGDGLEDCYAGDSLKSASKHDHEVMIVSKSHRIEFNYCPKCGEKL